MFMILKVFIEHYLNWP